MALVSQPSKLLSKSCTRRAVLRRGAAVAGGAALAALPLAPPVSARPPGFQGHIRPFIELAPSSAAPLDPFEDATGRPLNLLAFYGEVVVLNFWATWCKPCVWEMPHFDALQRGLAGEKARVLAVSVDELGAPQVQRFYERTDIRSLGIYLDPGQRLLGAFGGAANGLPITFVLDRRARVVGYMDGPAEWASEDAFRLVRHYAGARS